MPVKTENVNTEKAKKRLGNMISKCRGTKMSQRYLASMIGLSPSNMKYIEDGINCPTADVYSKIVSVLNPPPKKRAEMDQAYMIIRNTPPPDVCERVKKDPLLINALRSMDTALLTESQAERVIALFESFIMENSKGEQHNG